MKTLVVIMSLVFTGTANAQWRATECNPVQQHHKGGVTVQKHFHTYHHKVHHYHYPIHKYEHIHHWMNPQCLHFHHESCPPANPCDCQHPTYQHRQYRPHHKHRRPHVNPQRRRRGVKTGPDSFILQHPSGRY